MQRLFLLGLNHTTAPLEVREKLAFNAIQRDAALAAFGRKYPKTECVLLSTCNRVELYIVRAVHGHPRREELIEFLAEFHAVRPELFQMHLYELSEKAAAEHLFNVAASLDSMVLGETQILGQVREAYDAAHGCSSSGALLNPLFQRAIAVGKQVMHETALSEGRLSVASVAVDYARQIFDHFGDKLVLSIGAGKMAGLMLQHLAALAPRRLLVCNRDPAKATALVQQYGGEAVPFEALEDHLALVDIVASSTGSTLPIITAAGFAAVHKRRRYRPIFMLDIALPRDVEAAVGELDNVYLYNLDDLQRVVSQTQGRRKEAMAAAGKLVAQHLNAFIADHRARELGPVIDRLYRRSHRLAEEELARTLNKLPEMDEAGRAQLEELTRRIVNKLLHDPVQAMRRGESLHGPASAYLHAMDELFQLSAEPQEPHGDEPDSDAR